LVGPSHIVHKLAFIFQIFLALRKARSNCSAGYKKISILGTEPFFQLKSSSDNFDYEDVMLLVFVRRGCYSTFRNQQDNLNYRLQFNNILIFSFFGLSSCLTSIVFLIIPKIWNKNSTLYFCILNWIYWFIWVMEQFWEPSFIVDTAYEELNRVSTTHLLG